VASDYPKSFGLNKVWSFKRMPDTHRNSGKGSSVANKIYAYTILVFRYALRVRCVVQAPDVVVVPEHCVVAVPGYVVDGQGCCVADGLQHVAAVQGCCVVEGPQYVVAVQGCCAVVVLQHVAAELLYVAAALLYAVGVRQCCVVLPG
jgi:hypothetical protein